MLRESGLVGFLVIALMSFAPAHSKLGKPVIAVGDFSSTFSNFNTSSFRTMLETAISKTGKFELIERSRIADLLKEQGMSESGLLDGELTVGGISGVDYMLYGTITEIKLEDTYALIMRVCKGTLGIDARIVDVATGSIRMSERVVATDQVNTSTGDQNSCSGVSAGSFREIQRQVADSLATKMAFSLFPIKVIKATDDQVYLNYGAPTLSKGDYLKLVRVGESFIDPDTGEELGSDEEEAGLIQIVDVRGKFSIASVLAAVMPLETGFVANKLSAKEGKALAKAAKRRRR